MSVSGFTSDFFGVEMWSRALISGPASLAGDFYCDIICADYYIMHARKPSNKVPREDVMIWPWKVNYLRNR